MKDVAPILAGRVICVDPLFNRVDMVMTADGDVTTDGDVTADGVVTAAHPMIHHCVQLVYFASCRDWTEYVLSRKGKSLVCADVWLQCQYTSLDITYPPHWVSTAHLTGYHLPTSLGIT